MSWIRLLELPIVGALLELGVRALSRVLPSAPYIAYDRTPDRRWIAELDGYRAEGDTRAKAAAEVLRRRSLGRTLLDDVQRKLDRR